MTATVLLMLIACFLGAVVGFCAACLCFSMRLADEAAHRHRLIEAVAGRERTEARRQDQRSVSVNGYRASVSVDGHASVPPARDEGERKSLELRAERLRAQKALHPEAFEPVLKNPDDPDDIVL